MIGIRSLFLPPYIGSYYLSSQTLVGLEIQKDAIYATVVHANGHLKTITACYQQAIAQDDVTPYEERLTDALKKIATLLPASYDELIVPLSNSSVVFKELTVPFIDLATIKLVAPFEVEPLLPFALHEALVDVLVTHIEKQQKKSTILVAAVKRANVSDMLMALQAAGLKPTKFSVHLFEFYSIFKEIPEYHTDPAPTLCLETTQDALQCFAVVDGELANTRIVPRGYNDARFMQDIQFTLDNFNSTLPEAKKIQRILVATTALDAKKVIGEIEESTGIKTDEFLLYKVVHNNTIKAVNSVLLTTPFIACVGAALDLTYTRAINFLQDAFEPHDNNLLLRQGIVALTLMLICLGSLIAHTQFTQAKLRREVYTSQQEMVQRLKKELNLPANQTNKSLGEVIKFAKAQVTKQQEIWFALSSQNRYSFLKYLQELFSRLDPQKLGLTLTMLSINDANDFMTIEGSVRGYDELSILKQELAKPNGIFTGIRPPLPQDPAFFSIKIEIDKQYRED